MPLTDPATLRNRLLRRLPPEDLARLVPHLEPVTLPKDEVLAEPHQPFEHAFFFESGIGSIIAISPEGQKVESGLFGREGFAPGGLALGVESTPHRCIVQVAGEGHRLPVTALREVLAESPALQGLLLRYVHLLALQTSYMALSNAVHLIDERLARWLLMCHDRVTGDEIALTHEFMSVMLAVRRASVTTTLHVLEGNRFICAEQGVITITARKRLVEFAGDAYGPPRPSTCGSSDR